MIESESPSPIRDSGYSTPSLDRALAVLECVARQAGGVNQSEIAAELGLSANFVYRSVQSLTAHGYLNRDAEKRFTLSGKLLALSRPVVDDVSLTEAALPAMRWLTEETGEASHLGILNGSSGLVLERVIGSAPIKFYVERGTRFPVHTSAPGKCIAAHLAEPEQEALLRSLDYRAYQPWTLASRKEFERCLEKVRADGFAIDAGEHLEGHHCVGAPIKNAEGMAVAGIWITGPSMRLSEERMRELAPVLIEAGRRASEAFQPGRMPV